MSNPIDEAVFNLLSERAAESEWPEPIDGDQLLHAVSNFFARYLHCSEHQGAVLALWVFHTYSYQAAQVTPYLAIQSAQKQSGKTRCLVLLQLLCENAAFVSGLTTSTLFKLLQGPAGTLLLDESQASVGTRNRNKAPVLRAALAGSSLAATGLDPVLRPEPRNKFCPKAFAGRGPLPQDLADLSIPIILEPLLHVGLSNFGNYGDFGNFGNPPPGVKASSPKIERLHLADAAKAVKPLCKLLRIWRNQNLALLDQGPAHQESDFPPNLSPRQQDMIEPLLQIADICGDSWSRRSREALVALFRQQTQFDLLPNLQLLADLRDCFAYHGYPDRLATTDLLDWIYSLPARPWDLDGHFSAHTLARLLVPFNIRPRVLRQAPEKDKNTDKGRDKDKGKGESKGKDKENARFARGYELKAFQEPWQKHLKFDISESQASNQNSNQNSKIANKDAARDGVTRAQAAPIPKPAEGKIPQRPGRSKEPHSGSNSGNYGNPADGVTPAQAASIPKPAAKGKTDPPRPAVGDRMSQGSKIANKNAACDGVTPAQTASIPKPTEGKIPQRSGRSKESQSGSRGSSYGNFGNSRASRSPFDLHTRLHSMQESLRLQGRYDIPSIIKQFKPEDLEARLDWAEPNPEWARKMLNRHCLDFVTALHEINLQPTPKKT